MTNRCQHYIDAAKKPTNGHAIVHSSPDPGIWTPEGYGDEPAPSRLPPPLLPHFNGMAGLCAKDAPLRRPIIDGILRLGETMNVISATKTGKSWLVADLALHIVTGRPWLGRFEVRKSEVLYLDNELHPETLNYRIRAVAEARGIYEEEFEDRLHPQALRGKLTNIFAMHEFFEAIPRGKVGMILGDAKYRFERNGSKENGNNEQTEFYNAVDRYADMTDASFALVHHSTKGDQSE